MILSENMMLFILFVVWKINMDIKTGIDTEWKSKWSRLWNLPLGNLIQFPLPSVLSSYITKVTICLNRHVGWLSHLYPIHSKLCLVTVSCFFHVYTSFYMAFSRILHSHISNSFTLAWMPALQAMNSLIIINYLFFSVLMFFKYL